MRRSLSGASSSRFKSKGEHDGFWADNATDKNHPNAVEVKRGKLSVIGWVKMREPLRFKGKIGREFRGDGLWTGRL